MNIKEKKIENTILFFANKSKDRRINRLKLIKLIWLSDRLHLNKYGRLILKDRYKALPHGPVASKTLDMANNDCPDYHVAKKFEIESIKETNLDYFSNTDIETLEYVWKNFGDKDHFDLSDFSHEFPEWIRFEKQINDRFSNNSYDMIIQDFFMPSDKHDFSDFFSEEDVQLSKSEFYNHSSIESALRV